MVWHSCCMESPMRTGIADIRIQLRLELAAPLVLAALAGLWSLGMLLSRAGLPPWAAAGHFAVWGVAVALGLAAWLRKRAKTEPSSHGFDHLRAMAWQDLPDPALVCGEGGKVLTYNSRLADLLNLPADAPSGGRELADLIGEDPSRQVERQWLLDTLAQRGHAEAFEIGLFDSAGDQLTLEGKAGRIGGGGRARYGGIMPSSVGGWMIFPTVSGARGASWPRRSTCLPAPTASFRKSTRCARTWSPWCHIRSGLR